MLKFVLDCCSSFADLRLQHSPVLCLPSPLHPASRLQSLQRFPRLRQLSRQLLRLPPRPSLLLKGENLKAASRATQLSSKDPQFLHRARKFLPFNAKLLMFNLYPKSRPRPRPKPPVTAATPGSDGEDDMNVDVPVTSTPCVLHLFILFTVAYSHRPIARVRAGMKSVLSSYHSRLSTL